MVAVTVKTRVTPNQTMAAAAVATPAVSSGQGPSSHAQNAVNANYDAIAYYRARSVRNLSAHAAMPQMATQPTCPMVGDRTSR